MNYEQFDRRIRDAAMQKAFPVQHDVPDRLQRLLEQLSETRGSAERSREAREAR